MKSHLNGIRNASCFGKWLHASVNHCTYTLIVQKEEMILFHLAGNQTINTTGECELALPFKVSDQSLVTWRDGSNWKIVAIFDVDPSLSSIKWLNLSCIDMPIDTQCAVCAVLDIFFMHFWTSIVLTYGNNFTIFSTPSVGFFNLGTQIPGSGFTTILLTQNPKIPKSSKSGKNRYPAGNLRFYYPKFKGQKPNPKKHPRV